MCAVTHLKIVKPDQPKFSKIHFSGKNPVVSKGNFFGKYFFPVKFSIAEKKIVLIICGYVWGTCEKKLFKNLEKG